MVVLANEPGQIVGTFVALDATGTLFWVTEWCEHPAVKPELELF
jgi:hypothetical protein